ncbi:LPS assembly protein LptD [Sulfurovum sp. zt1-1]|uniref:LPS assembly protein LptD n=1 Tax=Sulfurovum zhangzhouensis TaxID=3019067 RepID=A0ABT7QWK7_9BACT|nr:LPS assembly protein LptD [Sulfurovum zhangzhouensis]MDM5271214.1 LPS assembly protein LptD [Sulfurovum zhangzhouensis]
MLKYLHWFFLLGCVGGETLYADQTSAKIEVLAKQMTSTKTNVYATGGVLVYLKDSVIQANRATYDRNTNLLILDGNIEMIGHEGSKQKSKHIEINTQNNEVKFEELFLMNKNDVWLMSENARKKEGNYTLGSSMISSCDINNPLWKIRFERSQYDSVTKHMKLYDAKVYFLDTPVLYTPYLSFNTDRQRSSGLLFPLFGYTEDEGFVYEQPIFWNISPSMDMEFNPQIRTDRSIGMYSTFRFVDSAYSSGKIRTGYFLDSLEYQQREQNKDREHYGFELYYDSSQFLSQDSLYGMKDGLYINAILLNDIDYINLQKTKLINFGRNPLQESRLNYFVSNDDFYAGINTKYFIDTREENNDNTLQVLPSVQLHKYLDHFIWKNLTYSVDMHLNNFYRKKGITLKQAEAKIPLDYTTSFFDDYLSLSVGEEFYYSKFFFGNGEYSVDQFEYYSNIHKAKLFTDLTKKYDGFIHVLQPALEYIQPGNEQQAPIDFEQLDEDQKELFAVGLPEEHYALSLSQYFYDETMNLKFFQRLSQKYYLNRTYKFGDISNEMQYNWNNWQFYNNIVYSYEFDKVRESSNRITLTEKEYGFTLGHTYKQILPDDKTIFIPANDVNFNFNYRINPRVKINGGLTYDIDEASSKQWRIGGNYAVDCWSMDLTVLQDITPLPTGSRLETSFFVQLNFIPFATIGTRKEEDVKPY